MKLGEAIYAQAHADAAADAAGGDDGDVVDAEYEEVDEDSAKSA